MLRPAALLLLLASLAPAWVESVEFPWNAMPRHLWERELAWLKNVGFRHVSLPPAADGAPLVDLIRTLRALDLEADLEGPVPEALRVFAREHGGPLTEALPAGAVRISALSPDATVHSRRLLTEGVPALVWTDVEDMLSAGVYRAGAVNFAGEETAATVPLRRNAQLWRYWGETLASLKPSPAAAPAPGVTVHEFSSARGAGFAAIVNTTAQPWTGDVRLKRVLLPKVKVRAHDSAWLPVNLPLLSGPLCRDCSVFAPSNRLVYATAELTAMEYENGILAMEFSSPGPSQVVLQLSREPEGPLVAGGKLARIEWDEKTMEARLPVPGSNAAGHHVRIGLAIEPPEATAFFESARVLLIGETNALTAEFSSEAIAQRSRLRTTPEISYTRNETKEPLRFVYNLKVPASAIHGDHAELVLEADGARMSHARPQLLQAASLRFSDAVAVRLAAHSTLRLMPTTMPVNQRGGREITVSVRNNAPAIRTFKLAVEAEGLQFAPTSMSVTVGASAAREVTFRVFTTGSAPGVHAGEARLSGDAVAVEPVRFVVVPQTGSVAWQADGFSFLESAKERASLLPGRWLEMLNKDNGQNALPPGGTPLPAGAIEIRGDALAIGQKTWRLADLENSVPEAKK